MSTQRKLEGNSSTEKLGASLKNKKFPAILAKCIQGTEKKSPLLKHHKPEKDKRHLPKVGKWQKPDQVVTCRVSGIDGF